jgi:sarcosine oxidase subunit beta
MEKTVVCTCEDVTLRDLESAHDAGMRDIESLKRYTGLGTGPCQGKSCMIEAVRLLERRGAPRDALQPFTPRPPLQPTTLAELAALPVPPLDAEAPPEPRGAHSMRPSAPVADQAEVVIIGAGIMGLGLAYNLARLGESRIVVLDKGYLLDGASGRNGGGVRAQFSSPLNIELGRESQALCASFAQEMGINVWWRKGGYLFVVRKPQTVPQLEASVKLHNAYGVPTRLIGRAEAERIVPGLDTTGVLAATYNHDDGVVFPWPFLWGYATQAQRRGVQVEPFTRVTGLETQNGRVQAVVTDRGRIRARTVVIAAGAWSRDVAALAGVKLPNIPRRHEICASEPLKPMVDPLVSELDGGLYFSQSMRGEIIGGVGDPDEPEGISHRASLRFLTRYSRDLLRVMPGLGAVKVMRQWAGCYDYTPDRAPILGRTPGVEGLLHLSGFVGHGFMMAPAVTRRMAAWMSGAKEEMFERYTLQRFAEGRLELEKMIIG